MLRPTLLTTSKLLPPCLLMGLVGTFVGTTFPGGGRPRDRLMLRDLQSAFHLAPATGDYELMRSIWAEDAVFRGGGNVVRGRDRIADFFRLGAYWGKSANLSPTYKSIWNIHGNTADIRFECVIVKVDGSSPLTTPLSTLPPGKQNPKVEIVQHSNATIEAVKRRGQWLIQSFTGAGGAITP